MKGILRKMKARLGTPIEYQLCLGDQTLSLNSLLGKKIVLSFSANIFCIQCGRKTQKSFQQGYCFPCYRRLLECKLCIIHPERCQVESGSCPEDDWAHVQCHQDHIIYLSNTSGLKIGITRSNQIPTRWIDQGAVQAVALWRVSNRYRAGVVEVACKAWINDKTNWRSMLKNEVDLVDMQAFKEEFIIKVEADLMQVTKSFYDDVVLLEDLPVSLEYPVERFPDKVTSLSFDKTLDIGGTLLGIKGQYLLFDTGVLNIRKFGGYEIAVPL